MRNASLTVGEHLGVSAVGCTACAQAGHGPVPFRSLASVHSVLAAAAFVGVVTRRVFWRPAPGGSQ